jgi:hypothetical protein
LYKILIGKLKGKRVLGRPDCRLEGNMKVGVKTIGWEGAD